jgi:hypothetical protein
LEQIAPSPIFTNAQDRNRTCTPVKALGPEARSKTTYRTGFMHDFKHSIGHSHESQFIAGICNIS